MEVKKKLEVKKGCVSEKKVVEVKMINDKQIFCSWKCDPSESLYYLHLHVSLSMTLIYFLFFSLFKPRDSCKKNCYKNSMTISTKTTNPNVQELEILVHHFLRALLRFLVRDYTMKKRGPRKTSFRSYVPYRVP